MDEPVDDARGVLRDRLDLQWRSSLRDNEEDDYVSIRLEDPRT